MPYEHIGQAPKRIAVIGGGISGLGAAHLLSERHAVVLLEADTRLGGHARTVWAGKRGDQWVDTGFIVFNYANYPRLTKLFETLDIPVAKSEMTFAASIDGGRIEYALNSLDTIFAQRRNIARPAFLRMMRDLLKFNAEAVERAKNPAQTIGGLLDDLGTGSWFRDYYLTPFSGAIWSTPVEKILDFPARSLVQFFKNHNLLNYTGQHQWWTVEGGSAVYVQRLASLLEKRGVDIRTGTPVQGVRRTPVGVEVRVKGNEWEWFDEVVFATHSDTTLAMLADASSAERRALGAIAYQPNEMVLHADPVAMPKRRKCWSAWNYTEAAGKRSERIDLSYWMNVLQPIPKEDPLFVTLNSQHDIRDELIYDTHTFSHPVYTRDAFEAQSVLADMNGANRTWFCGAWMKNGFHEDGLASACDVADRIFASDLGVVAA